MSRKHTQADLLTSISALIMCSGISHKIFLVVLCTWCKFASAFFLLGAAATLPNWRAMYSLALLTGLSWVLYKATSLGKDARLRAVDLLRGCTSLGFAEAYSISRNRTQADLLTSLAAWVMCFGIRVKIFWVVLMTWFRFAFAYVLHGAAATLPNWQATYSLALLIGLSWALYKAIPLEKDARLRAINLLRQRITLGPA